MRGLKLQTARPQYLAKRALSARLFVNTWTLAEDLKEFKPGDQIVLATVDGVPIGVCFCCVHGRISTFVRKAYRRQGIGTKLVDKMKEMHSAKNRSMITAGYGIVGSLEFWRAVNVLCYE